MNPYPTIDSSASINRHRKVPSMLRTGASKYLAVELLVGRGEDKRGANKQTDEVIYHMKTVNCIMQTHDNFIVTVANLASIVAREWQSQY
jgi:flagellar biosynthesis/type III secretory pathway ATPase